MAVRTISEHAQVTAVCVNFALDSIAASIREELSRANPDSVAVLRRVLSLVEQRKLSGPGLEGSTTAQ